MTFKFVLRGLGPYAAADRWGVLPPVDHSPKECLFPFSVADSLCESCLRSRQHADEISNALECLGQKNTRLDVLHIVLDNDAALCDTLSTWRKWEGRQ